jgi:aldose 1-epimerase
VTETIENNTWRLTISPRLGASPVALEYNLNGAWEPVMRPTPPEALEGNSSSPFSSYTLAPFSNRIRDGRFVFQGREYTVRANNAKGEFIHGDVRNRPWQVHRLNDNTLECRFDSREFSDANFPFPYTVVVTYTLEGERFVTDIRLENAGETAMPAGFGFHPYFVRHFAASSSDPVLTFNATGYYIADETIIPRDGAHPLTPDMDFSSGKPAYAQNLDTVYNGWDGNATLQWASHRLVMRSSSIFTHFIAFNGAPDGTIALEPITHATDGFNLVARGVEGTGVHVLETAESIAGTVTLRLEAV